MSHQPFIWKISLGGPISQAGQSFWGSAGWGQTVLARLMESQIWHQPASSVALWREGSEKGQWPLPTSLSLSSSLNVRYFSSSLYATAAFQAATRVQELRGSSLRLCVDSLKGTAGIPCS